MDDLEELPLSKNTKILFNLLEVRIFDISQALQVAGHKLSINQLKQNLEKQYNIFGQMEKIFHQLNINKLYELMKQVSQNYISIASILIDEKLTSMNVKYKNVHIEMDQTIEKQGTQRNRNEDSKQKGSGRASKRKATMKKAKQQPEITETEVKQCIDSVIIQSEINHKKLGGIHLFNESYVRGIQSLRNKWEAIEAKKRKQYNQQQLIKELIFKEMTQQVEVQKIHENDEISKFIKEGKVKHELYYHIEYEKDLESISVFLKQSQDDALKFLTETKKVNTDFENEDDIIINYHALIEILAEKKKTQFDMIENKIKEIVDTFKIKVDFLDTQMQIKEANIRELQYKLKRKQGKQISTQTLGIRNHFNYSNSTSSLEDIDQQHKAIVQMLRKKIDTNQKQLINLETNVRVKDQKLKKKDTEISALQVEIEKYKKNLKEEKQKALQIIRQKALNQNANLSKQSQKPQDSYKVNQVLVYGHENGDEDGFSKTNQRRKNKMMSGNYSTSIISTSSKYRMGRQDSLLSSGFEQNSQQYKRINSSFNSSSDSIPHSFNYTGLQYHLNQMAKGQEFKETDSEDISAQRQEGRNLGTILSNYGGNQTMISQGSNYEKEDQFGTMKRIGMPEKQRKRSSRNNTEKYASSVQPGHNLRQISEGERHAANHGNTLKQFGQKKISKPSNKSTQQKNTNHIFDSSLSTQRDPEFIFSAQGLLKKNAQALYDALFGSVESVDGQPFVIEDEIKKLKEFMSRYNQRQVQSRLRRVVSFLNLSEHTEQIEEKQVCEEEDTVSNSSKKLQKQNEPNGKSSNRNQQSGFDLGKETHKNSLRMRDAMTQADKGEKDYKPVDLQALKERKIKKLLPSSSFFNQLHTQIRVSGKGFNISKQEFIDLCQNITINQNHLISEHSSISESQDQSHTQSVHKTTIFNKYKQKGTILTQNGSKQESANHNNSRILKVEGQSIYEKNKEKGLSEHHKKKANENLQNQSEILKSHKFSITKEIEHEIRSIIPALTSNGSTQSFLDKDKKIKEFYAILKSQGARVDSLQKFQEMMELSKISLEDILKISKSLKSSKFQDIVNLFSHQCEKSKNQNQQKSFHIEPCCLHARRYEAFLQKLSITENSVRKMRKDLLNIHIFNIDGNESQKDLYKKNFTKQKSHKMLDVTNLPSSSQGLYEKSGQFDSFYAVKKSNDKANQKRKGQKQQFAKKATISAYIEAIKKTQTETRRENERKSAGNLHLKGCITGFLPQLATKGMSELIRD